jgi:hypothetical protein
MQASKVSALWVALLQHAFARSGVAHATLVDKSSTAQHFEMRSSTALAKAACLFSMSAWSCGVGHIHNQQASGALQTLKDHLRPGAADRGQTYMSHVSIKGLLGVWALQSDLTHKAAHIKILQHLSPPHAIAKHQASPEAIVQICHSRAWQSVEQVL